MALLTPGFVPIQRLTLAQVPMVLGMVGSLYPRLLAFLSLSLLTHSLTFSLSLCVCVCVCVCVCARVHARAHTHICVCPWIK